MNVTAVVITGIICITLIALYVIAEAGKTKRAKIEAETEANNPGNRFLNMLTGGSRTESEADDE